MSRSKIIKRVGRMPAPRGGVVGVRQAGELAPTHPLDGEKAALRNIADPTERRVKVLCLVPEPGGCAMWRAFWPVHNLQRTGYPCGWEFTDDAGGTIINPFDAIVINRMGWTNVEHGAVLRKKAEQAGKFMFLESDDDIWLRREDQKSQKELRPDLEEGSVEANRASLLMYHGVTVSTERLRTTIHSFSPNMPVEVVPNAIDLEYWEDQCRDWKRELPRDRVVIGWAGGDRYDRDVAEVGAAWTRIAADFPEVLFYVQGHQPGVLVNAVPSERLFRAHYLPTVSTHDTPFYGVGLMNVDIGCCAVAPTMFNAAKTPIKAWEFAASGGAVVGTPWLYGQSIVHGKNGLLAESADEWYEALSLLVRNERLRRRLGSTLLMDVREKWSMKANMWRWPVAWNNLAVQAGEQMKARVLVP